MRSSSRRSLVAALLLVSAMTMLTGCGDEGAHLPAGMTGASAAVLQESTGTDAISSALGADPGASPASLTSPIDDPILGDTGPDIDLLSMDTDDPFAAAQSAWDDTAGALTPTTFDDSFNDGFQRVGYGGRGYGDGLFGTAFSTAGAWGGLGVASMGNAGFIDPGMDAGIDPGFDAGIDPGFDAGAGFDPGMDVGMDPGVGFDPGMDASVGFDPGMDVAADPGFADVGGMDAGMMDVGFDAGVGF